jgi:glycerol-3-phosphate acyltransferase PlsY
MEYWAQWTLFSLLAYLIGSIPFSYLIARARGVDLRRVGSGNVGATNVARSVGLPYGVLAFLLDWGKGVLTAGLAEYWGVPIWLAGFAVVGHDWSLFMGLRSGKGVATSLGLLMIISWPAFLLTVGLWALVAWLTRYVSVASVSALLLSPLWLYLFKTPGEAVGLMIALGALSVFQHRENFRRLLRGQEHRLS